MKSKSVVKALERVETWPPHVQDEFAELALELDAGLNGDIYEPTADELSGIDRGLKAADEGRFATDQQVESVLAKFRKQ